MKKIIAIRHADGVEEYICPKCDSVMKHNDDHHPNFSRGEISETGGEYLSCPNCGMRMDYPGMISSDLSTVIGELPNARLAGK